MSTIVNEEIKNIGRSVKNIFQEKMSNLTPINTDNIQISEYMTRSETIDEDHLQNLMSVITEEGYLPGAEIWINAITGADGGVIQYRLIGGRHRLEACRRLGMEQIPAIVFQDLSDEEECIADRLNNQKDRRHKKVSYIEEAQHCLYLKETKAWSIRQIAHAKGISKSAVHYKLQIANLPESVQDIFMSVHSVDSIPEIYFREICRLKAEPHQVMLCKKVIGNDIGDNPENTEYTEKKTIAAPDIKKIVKELRFLEAQGKIAEEAKKYIRDEKIENITSIVDVEAGEEVDITGTVENEAWRLIMENIVEEESDKREKGLKYGTIPLWIRHCRLDSNLCLSSFYLLLELLGNDLRFKPEQNGYFFIYHGQTYKNTEDYLSHIVGVQERTLLKKILPELINNKYVSCRKPGDVMKFRINWDELFELYKKNAHHIPFHDGGVDGIPEDYTGKIHPTPYHSIYIENGKIKLKDNPDSMHKEEEDDLIIQPGPEQKPKTAVESEAKIKQKELEVVNQKEHITEEAPEITANEIIDNPVASILKDIGMGEKQIIFCIRKNNIETTLNILKYINELKPAEREQIKNLPGFIFKLVRDGFTPPDGFETHQEVEEKREKKRHVEDIGAAIRTAFESGEKIFFCPQEGVLFPIIDVINNHIFTYQTKKGISAGSFSEWPDLNFFGVAT